MRQRLNPKIRHFFTRRTMAILSVGLFVLAVVTSAFTEKNETPTDTLTFAPINTPKSPKGDFIRVRAKSPLGDLGVSFRKLINKDSVESVQAFASVYKVLMSPRCVNCHPAGDVPLQGDDSHLHTMAPKRGVDGQGLYAMKCQNCHQPTNVPGLHTPPGNPEWHLPSAAAKMVFQGRSPRQLARQLVDPRQNGGKTMAQLLEHAHDTLVVAGWHPGEGRTLPPMSHAAFTKAWTTWIQKGAYAPKP